MGWFSKLIGASTDKQPPVHVTDETFEAEVLRSDVPVVVDFWGEQCPPCKQLEPIMMAMAAKYDGRVKVCEAGVRQNIKAAQRFGVRGTPTVLYFRPGGKLVERTVGFRGTLYHDEIIESELLGS